jgi:hypothetical protein
LKSFLICVFLLYQWFPVLQSWNGSIVVFGVFIVQYTIEATWSMSGLTQSTTARLNSGFLHQQNNNDTCYYRGWESHRPPLPEGP